MPPKRFKVARPRTKAPDPDHIKELGEHLSALPADVARLIIEAAPLLHRKTAIRWLTVSKTVKKWIEPIAYWTVVLHSSQQITRFVQSATLRPSDFMANHVKVFICVYGAETNVGLADAALSMCSGVRDVVFAGVDPSFVPTTKAFWRLARVKACPRVHFACSMRDFGHLNQQKRPTCTHFSLDLSDFRLPNPGLSTVASKLLDALRHVTHLSLVVSETAHVQLAQDIWANIPARVVVFLLQISPTPEILEAAEAFSSGVKDPRLICLSVAPARTYRIYSPGAGAQKGILTFRGERTDFRLGYIRSDEDDAWTLADRILKDRRALGQGNEEDSGEKVAEKASHLVSN
ncbi:hypothetical protein CYLTODRAFT_427219 [Cylindrobasidium torrendii FP15055 ss-10]|uniref:Uncharacterized protein n=1 Tax=Cylindrobasidium torrendii FP15055 ss-10 TaxID=1314674 RepID=A0A0D7AUY9_9AGAR|nr:hypothetical protein CYLTODRAFT_427219 [Cylindrobasidium torrendii FP15055 ss-10]